MRISAIGTPTAFTFDVAAPHVECAIKVEVSIPASFMQLFGQCPMVAPFIALKGFLTRAVGSIFKPFRLYVGVAVSKLDYKLNNKYMVKRLVAKANSAV